MAPLLVFLILFVSLALVFAIVPRVIVRREDRRFRCERERYLEAES